MSVGTELAIKNTIISSGVTEYSYSFKILKEETLKVTHFDIDGNGTVLVNPTDYSIEGVGLDAGVVVLTSAFTDGTLSMERIETYTTETIIKEGSRFPATALTYLTDRITMMLQQINDRVERSIQAPINEDYINFTFPSLEQRRNTYLTFDENGALQVEDGATPDAYFGNYPFNKGDIIQYYTEALGGRFYISLQTDNQGHIPSENLGVWWDEYSFAAEGGLPNYLDNRFAAITADSGFTVTAPNSTTPIKEGGDILLEKDAADRSGTGMYWTVDISETDLSSKLQVSFNLKSSDADKLSVKVMDTDADPDLTLYDEVVEDVAEYNSVSEIYSFNRIFDTNQNNTLKVLIYCNSTSALVASWNLSDVSLGAPFYYTAPSTGDKAGTYKWWGGIDLPDTAHLYASGPAVEQADYPDLYSAIGHRWNEERQNAGWADVSSGTTFYPGPSSQNYLREALPPIEFTDSEVDFAGDRLDLTGLIDTTMLEALRNGMPMQLKLVSGTLPTGLSEQTYYVATYVSGLVRFFTTEAEAIAETPYVSISDAGSGTFQLIQVGGYLDDALEAHTHGTSPSSTGVGVIQAGSQGETSTPTIKTGDVSEATTSNETRGQTAYLTLIVRAIDVRSVELMKLQTNREDAGEKFDSYKAPDANGLGKYSSLVFDSSFTHNWSDYPELLAIGATDLAMYITDNGDGTFNMRDLSYDTGWVNRTDWTDKQITIAHNLGFNISDLDIQIVFSSDGTDGNAVKEGIFGRVYASATPINQHLGVSYFEINTNSLTLQTAVDGVRFIGAAGNEIVLGSSTSYYYRIIVTRKDAPQEGTYAYLRTKSLSQVILAEINSQDGYNGSVYRPTVQDISAADKTTSLDQFLSTGSSPKLDGWRIKVTWKDGDATYAHKFTSSLNLANEYVDLPAGDNSATFAWCGYGSGGLTLVKDEVNSQWIVETEGCFDKGENVGGASFSQWVNRVLMNKGTQAVSSSSEVVTFPIPFHTVNAIIPTAIHEIAGRMISVVSKVVTGMTINATVYDGSNDTTGSDAYWTATGEWRD